MNDSILVIGAYTFGLMTSSIFWYFILKRYVTLFDNLLDKKREEEYIKDTRPVYTDEQLAYLEALRNENELGQS